MTLHLGFSLIEKISNESNNIAIKSVQNSYLKNLLTVVIPKCKTVVLQRFKKFIILSNSLTKGKVSVKFGGNELKVQPLSS